MATIIVAFNLREGANPQEYEAWSRKRDVPTVNGLPGVITMRVQKVSGLLGSVDPAPYEYIEIIDVDDMGSFLAAIGGEEMQKVAAEFAEYADSPTFLVTDQSA